MTQLEIMTAKGYGAWGGAEYEVSLLTSYRTYTNSTRETTKTVTRFVLAFGSNSGVDRRWFRSDHARRDFMDKSFSNLVLTQIPELKREPREAISPLQAVIGEYLSSITFVMDYLQLDFSGYGFNMYSWPEVTVHDRTLARADDGYRDAMCTLIGETITEIDEYLDKGLAFQFKNGSSINLSLKVGTDFPCPEIAEFRGRQNEWIVWEVGEEPFD